MLFNHLIIHNYTVLVCAEDIGIRVHVCQHIDIEKEEK